MLDLCLISLGVAGLEGVVSEEVGDGAPGLDKVKVSGLLFLRRETGEELPEGSLIGVNAANVGGRKMLKLFLRRFSSDMVSSNQPMAAAEPLLSPEQL